MECTRLDGLSDASMHQCFLIFEPKWAVAIPNTYFWVCWLSGYDYSTSTELTSNFVLFWSVCHNVIFYCINRYKYIMPTCNTFSWSKLSYGINCKYCDSLICCLCKVTTRVMVWALFVRISSQNSGSVFHRGAIIIRLPNPLLSAGLPLLLNVFIMDFKGRLLSLRGW